MFIIQKENEYIYDDNNSNNSNGGGKPPKVKKGRGKWLKVGLILLVLGLLLAGSRPFHGFSFLTFGTTQTGRLLQMDNIKNVSIDVSSVNVTIKSTDDKEASVDIEGPPGFADNFSIEVDSSKTLVVKQKSNNKGFFDFFGKKEITIYLLEKEYNDVNILTSSGNITVYDLTSKKFNSSSSSGNQNINDSRLKIANFNASSGNITLEEVNGNEFGITTSSGNQTITDSQISTITFVASSGNISCDDLTAVKCSATTSSGNTGINFDEIKKINFDGISSSGNITLEFDDDIELCINANKNLKTDYVSNSSSKNKINLTTSSGTLRIH